jgi:hypothetical protein
VSPLPVHAPGVSKRSGSDVDAAEEFSTEDKVIAATNAAARNRSFILMNRFLETEIFHFPSQLAKGDQLVASKSSQKPRCCPL